MDTCMPPAKKRKALIGLIVAMMLTGCHVSAPEYARRADEVVESRVGLGGKRQRPEQLQWFGFFDDAGLRNLVRRALAENTSLEIAWSRLQEARAAAEAAQSRLLPQLGASGGVQRAKQRALPLGFGGQLPSGLEGVGGEADTRKLTIYNASLAASYEIDVWDRIRSRAEAADLAVEAREYDYGSLAMTVAASVTEIWLQLKGSLMRMTVLEDQLSAMRHQISLNDQRLGSGLIRAFEVSRQEQRLNELKEQLTLVRLQYQLLCNQLALLVGEPPQSFVCEVKASLPGAGSLPPLGFSAGLLKRRPDIQAAFARLRAGDARVAAAVADQLPKLRLSLELFTNAAELAKLGDLLLWTLMAGIEDTLFDGGHEKAQIAAAEARTRQALFDYRDVVLRAYGDVADALENERGQRKSLKHVDQQLQAARRGLQLSEVSYINGTVNYETFLEALMRVQQLELRQVQARRKLLAFRLQLHRALGGAWPEEMEKTVSGRSDEE